MTSDLASRLKAVIALVPGLELQEVDALAGLKSLGHTGQIARGRKPDPRASTVTKIARVLGTTAEWLVDGHGPRPDAEVVVATVEAARVRGRRTAGKRGIQRRRHGRAA